MSEQQSDFDELLDALSRLEKGDTATLMTDFGSITATVTATRWSPDEAVVTFEDCDADRRIRVSTERYDGWLDPLVDAYVANSAFYFDFDDPDPDSLRPVGSLFDVEPVSAEDDQRQHRGRA